MTPFEVIVVPVRTDTDRSATYDFLLVFRSNMGLSCTIFEIKFSHPRKFRLTPPPAERVLRIL